MSSRSSEQELAQAILQHIELGAYPESEDVASADIPSQALSTLIKAINKTRQGVKSELRGLSRQSAPDLDGWISQAKQLQEDIERSKETAREIVQEAQTGKILNAQVKDASSKVALLRKELEYNTGLADMIEELQITSGLLENAHDSASQNELLDAMKKLDDARKGMARLGCFVNNRFCGIIQRRETQIRDFLISKIVGCWSELVVTNQSARQVIIKRNLQQDKLSITLQDITAAMSELGILETYVSRLHRDLDAVIITPRFASAADGATAQLNFGEETCCISGRAEESSTGQVVQDVRGLIDYLTRCLPKDTYTLLLERLLPSLIVQIIANYLEPSVPISLDQVVVFKDTLSQISDLAQYIHGWEIPIPSDGDLSAWVERLPQIWLARRREAALIAMRSTCYEGVQRKKSAERVETQLVSSDDVMVSGAQIDEDWNAGWSEEDEHDANREFLLSTEEPSQGDEEEVASAWGLLEDPEETQQESEVETTVEDEEEAWGWGDEEVAQEQQQQEAVKPMASSRASQPPRTRTNGSAKKHTSQTEHEITLREAFTISAIPDGVLELIDQILSDAEILSQPSFPIPSISAAATALSSLPTLLLALYRATSRNFYASDPAPDMLIYNDSQDLAIRLGALLADMSQNHPLFKRLARNLEADIKLLHTHSRLAYGREMDSQRTILADLLSSTSGFASCTNPLNAREYSNAISDVIHRILDLDKVWKSVLSDSARLQSLGAILSHVIRKITTDILELADEPRGISEEESKQLKTFIDQILQVANLFEEDAPDGSGERRSLIHVYTPSWLRFVYLGEILEASLADIKFLWTDGELSLEFSANEVVDLIEALFAESQFRRDAIRDIKRIDPILR